MKWLGIYTNLPMDVLVKLPHPRSGDSQGHETFSKPSANKLTRNYDIEWSNHHPSLSTLSPKWLSRSKTKWWAIHTNLPVDVIIRLPHPRSGEGHCQKTFLAPSGEKETRNYDIECSNHHPSLSTLRPKGLSCSKMKWWAICTNLPVDVIVRLPHPWSGDSQFQETFLAPSADKETRNYHIECSDHHPSLSTLSPKRLSRSKMKLWAIHTKLPVDVTDRLFNPRSGDSQGQELFLEPSADEQTRHYDIEWSNHHPSLSTQRPKGLNRSKMKSWAIYRNLPMDVIVGLPLPGSGDSHGQQTFLTSSAHKPTSSYDLECSNHLPWLSTLRPKGLGGSKMK